MCKKEYERLDVTVRLFPLEDIIRTSNDGSDDTEMDWN